MLKKFYQYQINRKNLAEDGDVSIATLYQWKNMYLGKNFPLRMNSLDQEKQKELLLQEIEELQIHQLEKSLLEGAFELLKKDTGINFFQLNNQEKTILIDDLRN